MKTIQPVRLQCSRKKGARLVSPNGLPVVCVTRGTKWGNPFKAGQPNPLMLLPRTFEHPPMTRCEAYNLYARCLYRFPIYPTELKMWGDAGGDTVLLVALAGRVESVIAQLRGKNLACWCGPNDSCHADILLQIANAKAVS